MKVIPTKLIDSEGYTLSLSLEKVYEVLGIEADHYRILTDSDSRPYGNDPVLYEPNCFKIIDPTEPEFWVCEVGDEGERYCYPPEWNSAGFFEDYHDGIHEVRKIFWDLLKSYYPETWKENGKANQ
ncbi:hypothetical protein DSCO28_01930 [Desulfosarcina ovata subsp. sediminis]|uniref:Uncharacterized protein n=1 Tax=Desulfosarcina ovata subsp. sediminis TaxID=885957 RepID=A0A5K7ZI53_9BACT|nr:hypothetical protein [Desulfosarcina ovata]BBO79627.1 hypothetical protein DSCO28_01930 [Desulfosarcina ovata subsp. sediminis]